MSSPMFFFVWCKYCLRNDFSIAQALKLWPVGMSIHLYFRTFLVVSCSSIF